MLCNSSAINVVQKLRFIVQMESWVGGSVGLKSEGGMMALTSSISLSYFSSCSDVTKGNGPSLSGV